MDVQGITSNSQTGHSRFRRTINNKYLSIDVLLNHEGIVDKFDIPSKLTDIEMEFMDDAFTHITENVNFALEWYSEASDKKLNSGEVSAKKIFHYRRPYTHVEDCLCQLT